MFPLSLLSMEEYFIYEHFVYFVILSMFRII